MSKCAIHIILAEFLNDYLGCALGQQPLSLFCPCVVGKNWVFSPANKIHSTRLISIECYLEAHGVQPSSCKALEILTENRAKKKADRFASVRGSRGILAMVVGTAILLLRCFISVWESLCLSDQSEQDCSSQHIIPPLSCFT